MQQPQKQQTTTVPTPATPITETEMAKRVEAFPPSNGTSIFNQKIDGFEVNERRYIDPEGKIVKYGYDNMSADVNYLADTENTGRGDDCFLLKLGRAYTDAEAISIANAERGREG